MENFGERFKRIRTAHGYTQRGLASEIGISGAAISQWESGETQPDKIRAEFLDAAAHKLHTTVRHLLKGDGVEGNPGSVKVEAFAIHGMVDDEDFDPETGVMIPVYEMDVSGGPGAPILEFAETRYKLHFTRKWLKDVKAKPEEIRVARVRGDSMQPTLWDNDKVVIHMGLTRIRNERLFALAYAGEARVKRLYQLADGRLRVVSDNPDKAKYPDEFIEGDDLNNVLIIGQVIHKMGEGGL
jgi:transcriptional regulator with XRE-family HTH domain